MARPDGRAPDALRAVALERGANPYAEGSCLVRFGGTLVHCTASVEEGQFMPLPMRPEASM